MSAEGMRDGSDDAYLADPVLKGVTARGLAGRVRRKRPQRLPCRERSHDFIERDYHFGVPDAIFLERHEFDEAHYQTLLARELRELDDLILVEAAQQHAIYLHGIETCSLGRANAR